jgi:hypothetical protein
MYHCVLKLTKRPSDECMCTIRIKASSILKFIKRVRI